MQPKRPECKTTVAQNIFINMMTFRHRGDRNLGHLHSYDHLTVLSSGAIEVHCDGMVGRLRAPRLFLTPKDRAHQFYALEDNTVVACVHPLRHPAQNNEILPKDTPPGACGHLIEHLTRPGADYSKNPDLLDLPTDRAEYFVPEAFDKSSVFKAICDNTTVEIVHLENPGDEREFNAPPVGTVNLLGAGSLEVKYQDAIRRYDAPQVFIIPKNGLVVFKALASDTVIAKLQTLHGDERSSDQIAPEITLDYASEALQKVLQEINEQTTLVGSFRSPTFASFSDIES